MPCFWRSFVFGMGGQPQQYLDLSCSSHDLVQIELIDSRVVLDMHG